MTVTQMTIEEVRCFSGRQRFDLRPLTFLVGENSTGKTTTLACFQILANFLSSQGVNFSIDPYSMGVFGDIVRRSRKKEKSFSLGFSFEDESGNLECNVEFVQKAGTIEPAVKAVSIGFDEGEIVFEGEDMGDETEIRMAFDERRRQIRLILNAEVMNSSRTGFAFLLGFLTSMRMNESLKTVGPIWDPFNRMYERFSESQKSGTLDLNSVFSTSPVRSRPKRTYDPTREFHDPEGSDVPMRLMRIAATKPKEWEGLKDQLVKFGKASGLFQSIDIRNLGRSMGAPFQLRVKVRGPNSNIVDVGYGVSQILPILVQAFDGAGSQSDFGPWSTAAYFLLQQPEVHLHPKAQAELSSLLSHLASKGKQTFVVETHSDYMIDRARIEIRRGNIKSEDLSLIYLEPKRNVVNVHNIVFDDMGNMVGVPPHFRDFFLLESDRLMGFED